MTEATPRKEFSWLEGLAFCLAAVAIQLTSETTSQWATYFYSPSDTGRRIIYVSIALVGIVFIVGRVLDGLTDPLIGVLSDRTRTKPGRFRFPRIQGRRRPFIFWGSILLTFTFISMWFPPVDKVSWTNFFYALFIISLHWVFWTVCVIPLNSLLPEIARTKAARVKLGTWYAVGMILGLAIVEIAVPQLVSGLDPARAVDAMDAYPAETIAVPDAAADAAASPPASPPTPSTENNRPLFSPKGYQRTSLILAAIALLFFQFLVWTVRERHVEAASQERVAPLHDILMALKNKPCMLFLAAFFFQSVGILAVQKALPYWAELGLEGDESTITPLMAPFILMTLVTYAFVPALARRFALKWLMFAAMSFFAVGLPLTYVIAVIPAGPAAKVIMGGCLFGWCGIAQGLIYVLLAPILGEIVDLDEQVTGRRREAVYGGLHGVSVKVGQTFSILLATQLMAWLGHSAARPLGVYIVGPVAGLCAAIGLLFMWRYPVLDSARDQPAVN